MQTVIFYTKENCPLCDQALTLLSTFQQDYAFEIECRDIHSNDEWLEKYQLIIPVIDINGDKLNCEQMNFPHIEAILKKHCQRTH